MTILKKAALGLAAVSTLAWPGVASADAVTSNAENIRKLDIMLMVTSLRCRTGPHNFQADYQTFSRTHLSTLNRAAAQLQGDLSRRHGAKGAKRALDRISVTMANQYGTGHPWLECAALKKVTRDLTAERDVGRFSTAATELLDHRPTTRWAAL
ncbi:S-adenosyl-L-homocysteine hydrolase [Altererythrobacter arenosus]|uniref:S-adenosyl-L-homocysteine hydrolase n=1 Tax=Altererythrobacter arenosus TaxID=3032592 RepID=A0ABY8FPA3_9SPHN|nr:S-adenosyl-L-homocysteine hydrolase [Altererythrobacter sp. CAU 1644]WFL76839.1 S-adenosyl-L-homocysteine hydrolase [Altererythrobacter sp. CAU 1644]